MKIEDDDVIKLVHPFHWPVELLDQTTLKINGKWDVSRTWEIGFFLKTSSEYVYIHYTDCPKKSATLFYCVKSTRSPVLCFFHTILLICIVLWYTLYLLGPMVLYTVYVYAFCILFLIIKTRTFLNVWQFYLNHGTSAWNLVVWNSRWLNLDCKSSHIVSRPNMS